MVLFRTESIISAEERRNVWVGFSQFFLALLQEADSVVLNPTCESSDWLSCPSNNEDSRLRVTRIVWNVENLVSVQTSPLCGSLSHLSSSLPPSPPSCLFTVLPRPSLLFYLMSLSPRSPVLLNHLYPLLSVYQDNGHTCVKEKPGLKQCPGVSTQLHRKVFFLNCKMSKLFPAPAHYSEDIDENCCYASILTKTQSTWLGHVPLKKWRTRFIYFYKVTWLKLNIIVLDCSLNVGIFEISSHTDQKRSRSRITNFPPRSRSKYLSCH